MGMIYETYKNREIKTGKSNYLRNIFNVIVIKEHKKVQWEKNQVKASNKHFIHFYQ